MKSAKRQLTKLENCDSSSDVLCKTCTRLVHINRESLKIDPPLHRSRCCSPIYPPPARHTFAEDTFVAPLIRKVRRASTSPLG